MTLFTTGLHFFNPVSRMPLVEIVRGAETSLRALAVAYQLALDLGKVPVLCRGVFGYRAMDLGKVPVLWRGVFGYRAIDMGKVSIL